MVKSSVILLAVGLIISSCGSQQLEKQTAFDVIKKELSYPKVLDHDIYCADPDHVRKIQDAGLDKKGLVAVQLSIKMSDEDKSLIHFTNTSQPYLLPTPEKDKSLSIQKIKLADEDIGEIVSIKKDPDTKAELVEYTTTYKNVTPFAALVSQDFTRAKNHKAYLALNNGNWEVENTKGH